MVLKLAGGMAKQASMLGTATAGALSGRLRCQQQNKSKFFNPLPKYFL